MRNSTAIRECDVDTVRIISIKGISKVGNSFLSDLGRPGKSYIFSLFDIGLRVEWAKSLARAERWEEEVLLICEEMRRVLVFLDYKASQWKTKASLRREEDFEYACGFAAYCERQAYIFTSLAHDFASIWLSAIDDTELARPVTWPVKFLTVSQTSKQIQRRRLRTKAIQRVLPAQVVDEDEESRDIC